MSSLQHIILLLIIIGGTSTYGLPPLPPPTSSVAIGVISPVDHARKILTNSTSTIITAAPDSPLILYCNNISIIVRVDGRLVRQGNSTNGTRIILIDKLDPGVHVIQVSTRSGVVQIQVLTPIEEAQQAQQLSSLRGDPRRYKYTYAILAAITAVIAGYPLGIMLRSRREERRRKKVPYEQLRCGRVSRDELRGRSEGCSYI